jgi:hypothetical protein
MRKAEGNLLLAASWKRRNSPQAALLMLECDRSLASHRYTNTMMTQKMEMKIADGGSLI